MLDMMKNPAYQSLPMAGVVTDNNDPDKNRRVRVRVPAVHGDIPDDLLPWAVYGGDCGMGASESACDFAVPIVGALVRVFFQHGDPMNPMYDGGIGATGSIPAVFRTNYPHRYGFLLPNGTLFYADTSTNDVFFTNPGNVTIHVQGNVTASITGNVDATVGGSVTANVTGDVTANIGGGLTADCGGNAKITAPRIDLN